MNIIQKAVSLKTLLVLALCVMCGNAALAESKLSIDPVTFGSKEKMMVAVNFENTNPVVGMEFAVVLPSFLEFDGNAIEKNTERFTNHMMQFNPANGRVLIYSMPSSLIKGEDGPLVYLPVKVKDSQSAPVTGEIKVAGISFSGAASGGSAESWTQAQFSVPASYAPFHATMTPSAETLVVKPGVPATMGFAIEADFEVVGFQMDIVLPAGLTLADVATTTNRAPGDAMVSVFHNDGYDRLVYFSMSNTALTGNEGEVFTIDVTPSDDYAVAEATVEVKNIQLTNIAMQIVIADPFTVKVINEKLLFDELNTSVEALKTKLAEALATIAEECPNVKDEYTGEEISAKIETLSAKIAQLYAEGALTPEGDAIKAEIAAIEAEIEALVAAAKQAEIDREAQRVADNQAAYDAVLALLQQLQEQLDATSATAAEQYPDIDVTAEKTAAQEAIDAAKAAAEAAFEAVAEAGVFDYTVPEEDIEALIQAILTKAVGDTEENRKAHNEEAYNAAIAALDALQAQLDAAIAAAAQDCPHANVLAEVNAAQTAITNARQQVELAKLKCADEGLFDYTVPEDDIKALITAVTTSAQEQEAAWVEAQRQAANLAAYNASIAEIDALQAQLDAMKAQVAEEYPSADVQAEIAAAQQAIDDARAAATAAYDAVATEGNYEYTVPTQNIAALIKAILTAAQQSGISEISIDNLDPSVKLYNLSGRRVTNPAPGTIVIAVPSNGKPSKHIVH